MFFSQHFSFPCQYHSTSAPYSFIHLPPTLYNVFLPALQFPLSVSFHQCSILIFIYMLLLAEGQRAKPVDRRKINGLSEIGFVRQERLSVFLIGVTDYYKLFSVLKQTLRWIKQVLQIITTTLFKDKLDSFLFLFKCNFFFNAVNFRFLKTAVKCP